MSSCDACTFDNERYLRAGDICLLTWIKELKFNLPLFLNCEVDYLFLFRVYTSLQMLKWVSGLVTPKILVIYFCLEVGNFFHPNEFSIGLPQLQCESNLALPIKRPSIPISLLRAASNVKRFLPSFPQARCSKENLVFYVEGYPFFSVVSLRILPLRIKFTH